MPLRIFEPPLPATDTDTLATECIEAGCDVLLLDHGAVPPEFFDLSTRLLGSLLHRLGLYRIRLVVVDPDMQNRSGAFQDFVREANAGKRFRFFQGRDEAAAWLATLQED